MMALDKAPATLPPHQNMFHRLLFLLAAACCLAPLAHSAEKPNIVYIICDDLGYGDIHCLAPKTSKIATPHADQLAAQGMTFTDAHSGSSVCTPTRYGIMTGRYSWRTRLQKGVVTGFAVTIWMANDWQIMLGGKPFSSIPPYVIIAFELLVLFGGVLTVVGVFVVGKLYPRKLDAAYDPRFSAEDFGAVVACRDRDVVEIEELMRDNGAVEVTLVES